MKIYNPNFVDTSRAAVDLIATKMQSHMTANPTKRKFTPADFRAAFPNDASMTDGMIHAAAAKLGWTVNTDE